MMASESVPNRTVVSITDAHLTLEELLDVVAGCRVELAASARSRIEESRGVVSQALAGPEPVYGPNTGVGHMKDSSGVDVLLHGALTLR